ncbi:MAG: Stp1/IreP family PP2C-type Ser/Thr phosphatase [Bacilli bacterium]|jgi:protein phosphatase|nr:Stp1/IreP family PP2C-type Ser/Thr phosphatase [Bacilli bacterium]
MKKYAVTDIGKVRNTNQDQAFVYTNSHGISIGIICDGMGGHKAGGYASLLVSKIILDYFIKVDKFKDEQEAKEWLLMIINEANAQVREKSLSDDNFMGMGTTLVISLVLENKIIIANVGDSRVYLFNNSELMQITEDQTYVNILLREGKITKEEALNHPKKHVIMYAVGNMDNPVVDLYELNKIKGSYLFMCSDGIYNLVSFKYLNTILDSTLPISQKAISIINDANNNGGYDNMSIVLMEVE